MSDLECMGWEISCDLQHEFATGNYWRQSSPMTKS